MERLGRLATALIAIGTAAFVLVLATDTALHEPFWLDEGYEIVETCRRPLPTMLAMGARECSPAPLYWLFQTAVVLSVDTVDLSIRAKYRGVSITAAALTVAVLVLGLQQRLGLPAALLAAASLLVQPFFHHYAAQNRAYTTWMLATAVLVVTAAEVSANPAMRTRTRLLALAGAGTLVGLTALPGCLQALGAYAAFALVGARLVTGVPSRRRLLIGLALGAAAIALMDLHYWRGSPCRAYEAAGHLDIAAADDRWALIAPVVRLLWPDALSAWTRALDAAFVVGVATPLIALHRLQGPWRGAVALATVALSQLLVAIPVAIGLGAGHYLFLSRMFSFLPVARAVLVGVGFWTVLAISRERLQGPLGRYVGFALRALGIALVLQSGALAAGVARGSRLPLPSSRGLACDEVQGRPLRVVHRRPERDFAFTPNFLGRLGSALQACPASEETLPEGYALALDDEAVQDWVRVADEPPPGYVPMKVCGRDVTIEPGGRLRR